jgi:hypothetical protein
MKRLLVIAATTTAFLLASGGAAGAAGGGRDAGNCSGSSKYLLTVSRGKATTLKVNFKVSRAAPGGSWQLFGSDNGVRIFALSKVASRRGLVVVATTITNQPGADTIKASSYDATSGETCNATVVF